ncbi:hypothetical protein DPMN_050734 [Dreissena polymorpha]|uniref:Uncharacterized protein n=1 Tax=Dreissena polymorpha TaxID=45954 RepID=A0A9D4CHC5_DREPO|nr:hypothetical protein DPMN_050734 [Dreissena polymorpha]
MFTKFVFWVRGGYHMFKINWGGGGRYNGGVRGGGSRHGKGVGVGVGVTNRPTDQRTNRPTDQQTNRQTGQKQYVPHYYTLHHCGLCSGHRSGKDHPDL